MLIAMTVIMIPAGGAYYALPTGEKAKQRDEMRRLNLANGVK
jgi:hypothetical protein